MNCEYTHVLLYSKVPPQCLVVKQLKTYSYSTFMTNTVFNTQQFFLYFVFSLNILFLSCSYVVLFYLPHLHEKNLYDKFQELFNNKKKQQKMQEKEDNLIVKYFFFLHKIKNISKQKSAFSHTIPLVWFKFFHHVPPSLHLQLCYKIN